MILVVEEEVKGQGDHNHPYVLDGDHVDEFDGLAGIIRLYLNDILYIISLRRMCLTLALKESVAHFLH